MLLIVFIALWIGSIVLFLAYARKNGLTKRERRDKALRLALVFLTLSLPYVVYIIFMAMNELKVPVNFAQIIFDRFTIFAILESTIWWWISFIYDENDVNDYRRQFKDILYNVKIPFLEDDTDLINYLTRNKIPYLTLSEYGNDVIQILLIDSDKYNNYKFIGIPKTKLEAHKALISYLDEKHICYYSDKDSFIRGTWQAAESLDTESLKRLAKYFKVNNINGYFTLEQAKRIVDNPVNM